MQHKISAASRDVAATPLTERSQDKYWFLANRNIVHETAGSNSQPSSSYKLIIHYLDSTRWQRAKVNKWLVKIVEYQAKQKTYYFVVQELADQTRAKLSVVYIRQIARKRIPMQCPFCAVKLFFKTMDHLVNPALANTFTSSVIVQKIDCSISSLPSCHLRHDTVAPTCSDSDMISEYVKTY